MFQPMLNALRRLGAGLALAGLLAGPVAAQGAYPNKPVRFLVPYAAGGLPDTVARVVAQAMQERLGQPVIVENRPGANGSVAASALVTAPADGYTLMVTDGSMLSINPFLYDRLAYDPNKDFVPVSLLARSPLFLAVHPSVPANSLREFIDYLKARPGQINYGSSGIGSSHHLSMEAIKAALGLRMTHVPFKGSGQSVPALIGGQVETLFSAYPSLAGFVKDHRVRILATNAAERSAQAPDVPAIAELIPGYDFSVLVGIIARTGTPEAAIRRMAAEAAEVLRRPDVVRQLAMSGIDALGQGPEEYGRAIRAENERVAKVVQAAGIRPE